MYSLEVHWRSKHDINIVEMFKMFIIQKIKYILFENITDEKY